MTSGNGERERISTMTVSVAIEQREINDEEADWPRRGKTRIVVTAVQHPSRCQDWAREGERGARGQHLGRRETTGLGGVKTRLRQEYNIDDDVRSGGGKEDGEPGGESEERWRGRIEIVLTAIHAVLREEDRIAKMVLKARKKGGGSRKRPQTAMPGLIARDKRKGRTPQLNDRAESGNSPAALLVCPRQQQQQQHLHLPVTVHSQGLARRT